MVNIKVGDKAPDFTLPDIDMKSRSLSEFLGKKVVLAFFAGAFTSTCTKEMCQFRDSMARLIGLKAQVVGVSVNDPFSNKGFAEKNILDLRRYCFLWIWLYFGLFPSFFRQLMSPLCESSQCRLLSPLQRRNV